MFSPFLDPDNPTLAAMIGDAAVHVLAERGIGDLSSRAIAAYLRMTPPALTQRANRAEQVRLLVLAIGQRWVNWSDTSLHRDLPAEIPRSEDERHGLRVWSAVAELARGEHAGGNPVPAHLLDGFRREERDLVGWNMSRLIDRPAASDEITHTVALVTGLRHELCSRSPALTVDQAETLVAQHLERLRSARVA